MDWVRIRELVRKEFIQLFRDKRVRPLLIISPIVQLIIFGYVVSTDVRDVTVAIMDQSKTVESRRFIDTIDGNRTFRTVRYRENPRQIEDLLLRRKVDLVIKIPPRFSRTLRSGRTASVQVLVDGSMSNMASVRIAYLMNVIQEFNVRFLHELYPRKLSYGKIDARIRTWYNPNLDSRNFYVPGVVAFLIMLLTLLFTSMAVIREKESGTMEQLIVTPLKPVELILGKTIPYIIVVESQMVIVTLFAIMWFHVPMEGSALLLFIATCLFLLSTLGIGLFISTVSVTQQQAMMTTFFFALPFFMLSGFVFPIGNMPEVFQWLTLLNPLRYLLVIIRGIFLKGVGFEILWPQFLGMAVLGTVVLAGAVNRFKKRLD
jgi:ABC-2 type transport system permease protein